MRRLFSAVVVVGLFVSVVHARSSPFTVSAGKSVFWKGPFVTEGAGRTWTYQLRVVGRGHRLRIGFDHPQVGDVYEVTVLDPSGTRFSFGPGSGIYSSELIEDGPIPGMWRIVVRAQEVTRSAFRIRAKLEARPPSVGKKGGPVLPNLQILPAHEASFLLPVTNGSTDGEPRGADLQGAESCHPEEHVEDQAVRCLRFAFGIRNTGLGPLQLHLGGGVLGGDQELLQRIQNVDGSYIDRPAGTARYHKTHGHYHHDAAVGLQLFKVADRRTGKMTSAGDRRTKGFAHREELLRDWDRFYPTWPRFGFGLSPGWADIYEWDRPGNHIDFDLNTDGYYVLRMWADPVRGIKESNESDNGGYTYLKVTGDVVKVLEVGRGSDPWDRCRIVMGPGGYPDPPRKRRPASCPPDTT